jgi:hypothetical protein
MGDFFNIFFRGGYSYGFYKYTFPDHAQSNTREELLLPPRKLCKATQKWYNIFG